MPFSATVYRVLIASPDDVDDERKMIPQVIHDWNAVHSGDMEVVLLPILWETHATPSMGEHPQSIINHQIVDSSDILIGVFWTRLGTPTESAESGTAEEIQRFIKDGKPVLLYFSSQPVQMDSVKPTEYQRLRDFREQVRSQGLFSSYDSLDQFRRDLSRHLLSIVRNLSAASVLNPEGSFAATSEPNLEIQRFRAAYEAFGRRLLAEWTAERDSNPMNIDGAKEILRRARNRLLDFRSDTVVALVPRVEDAIDPVLRDLRAHENYIMTMDTEAWDGFWTVGTELVQRVANDPIKVLRDISDNGTRSG